MTSEGGVVNVIRSTMLLRNDMLDVVLQLAILLAEQAIFAPVVRSTPDVPASIFSGRSNRAVAGL